MKREANKGQQRYITRTAQFNRDNNLQVPPGHRRTHAAASGLDARVRTRIVPGAKSGLGWPVPEPPSTVQLSSRVRCALPTQPHDVLWLQRGPRRDCLLFGVWRWGSQVAGPAGRRAGTGGLYTIRVQPRCLRAALPPPAAARMRSWPASSRPP